jgi:hypothetical protein
LWTARKTAKRTTSLSKSGSKPCRISSTGPSSSRADLPR